MWTGGSTAWHAAAPSATENEEGMQRWEDSGATCFFGFDCLLFLLSLFVFEIFVVFLINILTCIFIFYFYCLFLNFSWWGMLQG